MTKLFRSFLCVFALFLGALPLAAHPHSEYISSPLDRNSYYLHKDALAKFPTSCKNCRAAILGGEFVPEAMKLIKSGWMVSVYDKDSYASNIVENRVRLLYPSEYKYGRVSKRLQIRQSSIAKARPSGKHDYVFSFYGVPYEGKKSVLKKLRTLGPSIRKKGILAVNFFGNECDAVKNGEAFSINKKEIIKTFRGSGYKILYLVRRKFTNKNDKGKNVQWDIFDVIAQKK